MTGRLAPTDGGMNRDYNPQTGDEDDIPDSWGKMFGGAVKEFKKLPQFEAGSWQRKYASDHIKQFWGPLGMAYSAYTAATGWDPVAGACSSTEERILDGIGVAAHIQSHVPEGIDVIDGRARRALSRMKDVREGRIKSINNTLRKLGTHDHIATAINQKNGIHVPKLGTDGKRIRDYNHIKEVQDAYTALNNSVTALALDTSVEGMDAVRRATGTIKEMEERLRGTGIL